MNKKSEPGEVFKLMDLLRDAFNAGYDVAYFDAHCERSKNYEASRQLDFESWIASLTDKEFPM